MFPFHFYNITFSKLNDKIINIVLLDIAYYIFNSAISKSTSNLIIYKGVLLVIYDYI